MDSRYLKTLYFVSFHLLESLSIYSVVAHTSVLIFKATCIYHFEMNYEVVNVRKLFVMNKR